MNFTDILGSILSNGMTPSANQRVDHSVNHGGLGDILDSLGMEKGGSGGDILGELGKMAGAAVNSGKSGGHNPLVTGGLGALLGALLGGGKGAGKGAMGGTLLALLGSLALKVLRGKMSSTPNASAQLMAGLKEPENEQEAQELESLAELTLKAMLNAAKADSTIDHSEMQRILGEASENGLTQEEQEFITRELNKPIDLQGLIDAIPNQQIGVQIYAASLLAIEVDSEPERHYLRDLATGLGLDDEVTGELHRTLGIA